MKIYVRPAIYWLGVGVIQIKLFQCVWGGGREICTVTFSNFNDVQIWVPLKVNDNPLAAVNTVAVWLNFAESVEK